MDICTSCIRQHPQLYANLCNADVIVKAHFEMGMDICTSCIEALFVLSVGHMYVMHRSPLCAQCEDQVHEETKDHIFQKAICSLD